MAIKLNLDELMRKKGITLEKLAEKVGIAPPNLSNIKTGKISSLRLETLDKICAALGCTPGDLLEYEGEKSRVIPMFLDYTGTTDLLLNGGAENVKIFFDSVIAMQRQTGAEIRICMVTGSALESAKSKFEKFAQLAENYNLPNLFDCAVAEYCGYAIRRDSIEGLLPIDPRIVAQREAIETIISKHGGDISKSTTSYYNTVYNDISRTDLARLAEELEGWMHKVTGDDSIEALYYYDDYGRECDIKPKGHTKPKAVAMLVEQMREKHDVPLVIIGGDSKEEDLRMYDGNQELLSSYGIPSVFIAPANIGEITTSNRNIIIGDWENSDGIADGIKQMLSRLKINIRENGGLEL